MTRQFTVSTVRDVLKSSGRTAIAALALIGITLMVYAPALRAGFIWDDDLLVTGNPLLTSPGGLRAIWFSSAAIDYTPLTSTTFWIEWRLWGANPAGYHLVNILLFTGAVLLLWRLLRALAIPGAWWGALLFAVHPVNVASVAWIAERKNALSLCFYLLAILFYLEFYERPTAARYSLACFASVCAFLAKSSTVILPAALLICVWWRYRKLSRADLLRSAPLFLLAAAAALITIYFQGRFAQTASVTVPIAFRIVRAGDAVWFYLWKDVWPLGLCSIYPKWPLQPGSFLAWVPALACAALLLVFFLTRQRRGRVPFAFWSYYVCALLPVLGFVNAGFMDQAYVADWWQQLALPGVTALAGALIARASVLGGMRMAVIMASAGAVAALLAFQTFGEASAYHSMETQCLHTLARNPASWSAHTNLAMALLQKGDPADALSHLREALKLDPSQPMIHFDYANALASQGQLTEAAAEYQEAIRLRPDYSEARNNFGLLLEGQGRLEEAIQQYRLAIQYEPAYAEACHNLGFALQAQGHLDDAISWYRRALNLRPGFAEAHFQLGNALRARGRTEDAILQYRQALQCNPRFLDALQNLGNALFGQGKLDEAIAEYRQALAIDPAAASICYNLGGALLQQGRPQEAISHLEAAANLTHRGDPSILRVLAAAYAQAGRYQEAISSVEAALELPLSNPGMTAALREDLVRYENQAPPPNPASSSHQTLPPVQGR